MNRVKKIVSIVLILLLMVTSISAAVSFSSVDQSSQELIRGSFEKKTWYVDDNGTADFTTVQDAVDAASSGDTIFVYSGLYVENIIVDKTLSLIGEDKNTTILDGNDTEDTIFIADNADYVEITGFTIQHAGIDHSFFDRLIDLRGDHAHIHHNFFTDTDKSAIIVEESSYNTIEHNRFYNIGRTGNGYSTILLYRSIGTIVKNNVFNNLDTALLLESSVYDCIVTNNTINKSTFGIHLSGCDGCSLFQNTIMNCHRGVLLEGFNEMNAIYENNILDCDFAIDASVDSPNPLPAWNYAFHNNLINNTHNFVGSGGTHRSAPYPIGGNYFSSYNGTDEYHGPNQDIPGSDGIYDNKYNGDKYPFVEKDGWTTMEIEPTLLALGGIDLTSNELLHVEPGERIDYQFYVMNGGNTGSVNWRIEETPGYGTWEFEQTSGSIDPGEGMVRVNFTVTAPDERNTAYSGTITIVNEDNPENYFVLQADLSTPIIHPFVLFMKQVYDFFQEILDYFQGIISRI